MSDALLDVDRDRVGRWVILVAVVLLVGSPTVSYLQAHASSVEQPDKPMLVGVQGPADDGRVVALDSDGDRRWAVTRAVSYHDVSRVQTNVSGFERGQVLVTFAARVSTAASCDPYDPPCGRTGVRVLEPRPGVESADVVAEWSFPVRTLKNSEVHDAEVLPSGRVIVVGMDRERLLSVDVFAGDARTIWAASQFYDAPTDPTRTDWLHINDVDWIGADRYLVSVRNANQLVIVENGSVDEVVNEDRDPDILRQQHNPQWLGDGTVLVADSENQRVVELRRNDTTGQWKPVWAVEKAGGVTFAWPRDADRLANGNTVITDSRNHRVVVVDEEGDTVATRQVPALPYEADVRGVEPLGGPTHDRPSFVDDTAGHKFGVISLLWAGISHTVPVPWWLSARDLVMAILAMGLVLVGVAVRVVPDAIESAVRRVVSS